MVAWKSDVRLHCRVVGVPEPKQEWRNGTVLKHMLCDTLYRVKEEIYQAVKCIAVVMRY